MSSFRESLDYNFSPSVVYFLYDTKRQLVNVLKKFRVETTLVLRETSIIVIIKNIKFFVIDGIWDYKQLTPSLVIRELYENFKLRVLLWCRKFSEHLPLLKIKIYTQKSDIILFNSVKR